MRDDRPKTPARRPTVLSRAERDYTKQLKLLARNVGSLVESYASGLHGLPTLTELLRAYAQGLAPWAQRIASRMLGEVDARDRDAWRALGASISTQLHQDIRNAPVGERMRELLGLQVSLIQSIPIEAAERVQRLAVQARIEGTRAKEIAEEIARTGEVTKSRAVLIAQTETSRAATVLLQARCEAIGSTHYTWETARDGSVRAGHKKMQSQICEWAHPPAVEENGGRIMHFHPGEIWRCRCWASPIIGDPYKPERRGRVL